MFICVVKWASQKKKYNLQQKTSESLILVRAHAGRNWNLGYLDDKKDRKTRIFIEKRIFETIIKINTKQVKRQ